MVVEQDGYGTSSGGGRNMDGTVKDNTKKKSNLVPRMVPFLSKKSVIALAIGLIVGVGLGFGYWALSPTIDELFSRVSLSSPSIDSEYDGPHQSTVSIEIVNPGSGYTSLKDLQWRGEYYAAKANTFPFFNYLSEELSEQAPEYAHTSEELDEMTLIRYDWDSESPAIELIVTGSSQEETLYLAGLIPQVFLNYLTAEENKMQLLEYENTLAEIERVQLELFDAEKELADLALQMVGSDTSSDPDYIRLQATVAALNNELEDAVAEMAILIAQGDTGENYDESVATVNRISTALASVRDELTTLEAENTIEHFAENRGYLTAQVKVDSLNQELTQLTITLSEYAYANTGEPSEIEYLVVDSPSTPVPVLPERIRGRNAAMIGGICGVGVAWVAINRKWIIKQLSSSEPEMIDGTTEG